MNTITLPSTTTYPEQLERIKGNMGILALEAGATHQEVMEALEEAVLMGGGPSVIYATHVAEALEQFGNGGR